MFFNAVSFLDGALGITIFVLSMVIAGIAICGTVVWLMIHYRYFIYNRTQTSSGATGELAARHMLDSHGLTDYEVKKCGFFRTITFGNSYSPGKKTVFLRRGIFNRDSVTAVATACQKVGLALQHSEGDKKFMLRYKLMFISWIGPQSIFPLILVGLAMDLLVAANTNFMWTMIGLCLGLVFFVLSMVFTGLQIPVEKKGVEIALNSIIKFSLLSPAEIEKVTKLYDVYILNFVLTFIIEILQVVKVILQIIWTIAKDNDK